MDQEKFLSDNADLFEDKFVNLKVPDSRIIKSDDTFFISYAPSASIVPIDKGLAIYLMHEQTILQPDCSDQELSSKLNYLVNLKIAETSNKHRKAKLVYSTTPPVKTLIFHVTSECNLRCKHCYVNADELGKSDLSTERIKFTLKQFADMGGLIVDITGGEPLLREDIMDILATAKNAGLHVNLLSNGAGISSMIAKELKANVSKVTIGVDGLDETHNWIRGEGVFGRIAESINYLREAKVPTGATTMFTYKNLEQLELIQQFLITNEVNYWSLVLPRQSGRFKSGDIPEKTCKEWFSNLTKYYAVLNSIQREAKKTNMDIIIDHVMIPYDDRKDIRIDPESLNQSLYSKGRICWDNTITILSNGSVKGCLFIDDFIYGNIKETDLRMIYLSDGRKKAIEQFKEMKGKKECPIIPICNYDRV